MRGVKWFWLVVVPVVVVAAVVVWWLMPRPVAGKSAPKSGVSRSQAVPKKRVTRRKQADVRFEGVSDARVVEVEKKLLGDRFQGVRASAGDSALASRVLIDNWDCASVDECVPTAHGVGVTDEDTYNHEGKDLMQFNGFPSKRLLDCRVFSQDKADYMVCAVEASLPSTGVVPVAFGGRVGVELGEKVWFVDSDTFA